MSAQDKPLPISVAMMARNAAALFPFSLGSVHGWVAEIVVVINDCSDETRAVAEKVYGAKVIENPWRGACHQKNFALEHCTQEWVLSLDADEQISRELRASIEKAVRAGKPLAGAMNRQTKILGQYIRHGDWYPDRTVRLIRRGYAHAIGLPEHHQLVPQDPVVVLEGDMMHDAFPDLITELRKMDHFTRSFLRRKRAAGKRSSLLDVVFRPCWRFFRSFILRGGFRDGLPGLYVAAYVAYGTFVKHAILRAQPEEPASGER